MPAQPIQPVMLKNTQTDYGEGFTLVRDLTAIDGVALANTHKPRGLVDAGGNLLSGVYRAKRASLVELRFWSDTAAATPTIQIVTAPMPGPGNDVSNVTGEKELTRAAGSVLWDDTVTTSGPQVANLHPVTGATEATTFHEMSDGGTTFNDVRVHKSPSSARAGINMTLDVDMKGDELLFVRLSGISTAGRFIVAARRVQ